MVVFSCDAGFLMMRETLAGWSVLAGLLAVCLSAALAPPSVIVFVLVFVSVVWALLLRGGPGE